MVNSDDIYDQLLVIRCQEGSREALAELVERWQTRLYRQALRMVEQPSEAEELVQVAWLAIVRGINRLQDPACFRRWAYQIVTNKSADWVRKRQQDRSRTASEQTEIADPHSDGKQAGNDPQDEIGLLRGALREMPTDKRALLSMFYLEGMSLKELSTALSLPVGTVKSRLHYAREQLKEKLERSKS